MSQAVLPKMKTIKVLGVYIINILNFEYHVSHLYKKGEKVPVLVRINTQMEINEQRMLMNAS